MHVFVVQSAHALLYLFCLISEVVYHYFCDVLFEIFLILTQNYLIPILVSCLSALLFAHQFFALFIFRLRLIFRDLP
jgi:hypothetical protein